MTIDQIIHVEKSLKEKKMHKDIAKELGVSKTTISECVNKRRKFASIDK